MGHEAIAVRDSPRKRNLAYFGQSSAGTHEIVCVGADAEKNGGPAGRHPAGPFPCVSSGLWGLPWHEEL